MSATSQATGGYRYDYGEPQTDSSDEVPSRNYSQLTNADTKYRTYLDYKEVKEGEQWMADYWKSNKRDYFQHLDDTNKGIKNGPVWRNSRYDTYMSNRDLIWIIADQLGLTCWQKPLAEAFFTSLQLGKWGLLKELVAVAVCLYLIHSDERDERRCHPRIREEDAGFLYDALEKFELRYQDFEKTYSKVQTYYWKTWGKKGGGI